MVVQVVGWPEVGRRVRHELQGEALRGARLPKGLLIALDRHGGRAQVQPVLERVSTQRQNNRPDWHDAKNTSRVFKRVAGA